ncbi:hypothetical protein CHS0354_037441 [Potamilus streckersoni]|uniref:Uncharacterized protein n=1 Tax=Potamilus streckersoni TaxID=2493646 RepID=A0AAE0SMH0_9BIVA|nr:hypothetical protein CHS0354_037441 [Potamilus streckersoni]
MRKIPSSLKTRDLLAPPPVGPTKPTRQHTSHEERDPPPFQGTLTAAYTAVYTTSIAPRNPGSTKKRRTNISREGRRHKEKRSGPLNTTQRVTFNIATEKIITLKTPTGVDVVLG